MYLTPDIKINSKVNHRFNVYVNIIYVIKTDSYKT